VQVIDQSTKDKRTTLSRHFRNAIVTLMVCGLMSGCALIEPSAARTNSAYRAKAEKTAKSVNSSIQTALLTIKLLEAGKVTVNTASVQIDDASDGVTGPHHAFDRVQSPSVVSDNVESSLDDLLNRVDSEMSGLSTSLHRHDLGSLSDYSSALNQLSGQLQQFAEAQK
jgi:hypothetical protein